MRYRSLHIITGIVLAVVLISGCKTSLRSGWRNFNAYYNTYYNAKQYYESGYQKLVNQSISYNPEVPIRVHRKPLNIGNQDFQLAIEKGADILRKYNESKWVDDALLLIGRSYYFRQEYFSADQKFDELYTNSEDQKMKQRSVLWKGRTLLELQVYNEGIAYLNDQILEFEGEWDKAILAETYVVVAEHFVMNEDWENASSFLEMGIPDLPERELKERSYMLLGQLYERLDDREAALNAYDKVADHFTEYNIQYLARRKKADMARSLGQYDLAYSIFNNMVRDDKNTEFRADLNYELGRTEQLNGNIESALDIYNRLLRNQLVKPDAITQAKTYYGLAEIYRFDIDDFGLAAAYYDSAAQKNVDISRLPEDYNADELADSFGQYSRLKNDIAEQDSLLKLGRMSPQMRDSAIAVVRARKIAELEELRREQQSQQNTMVNLAAGNTQDDENATNNGFLNSKSPATQQQRSQAFRAVWGNRPLVDNWRYQTLLQVGNSGDESVRDENSPITANNDLSMVELNLERIPVSTTAQDSVEDIISTYNYQLGNLFFLSLNDPDSATFYFVRSIQDEKRSDINAAALYSLSELKDIQGFNESARAYANQLAEQYPASTFAKRLSDKFDISLSLENDISSVDMAEQLREIRSDTSLTETQKGQELINFSNKYSNTVFAAEALNDAINVYLNIANKDSSFISKQDQWLQEGIRIDKEIEVFSEYQDSLDTILSDTSLTLTPDLRRDYRTLVDSTIVRPERITEFPYEGAYWDTVRTYADQYLAFFRSGKHRKKIELLKAELSIPEQKETDEGTGTADISVDINSEYTNCGSIGASLSVRSDISSLRSAIQRVINEKTELTVRFFVNGRGIPDRFELPDDLTSAQKEELNNILEQELFFEPVLEGGQAVKVSCPFTFSF